MRRVVRHVGLLTLALAALAIWQTAAQAQFRYPPVPGYPYGSHRYASPEADLRVQVTPKEASVYVDGYFAGVVDDFDGVFQRLRVLPGQHEIVVHLEGHRSIRERLYLGPNTTRKIQGALERLAPGEPDEPKPEPIASPDPPQPLSPDPRHPDRGVPRPTV